MTTAETVLQTMEGVVLGLEQLKKDNAKIFTPGIDLSISMMEAVMEGYKEQNNIVEACLSKL